MEYPRQNFASLVISFSALTVSIGLSNGINRTGIGAKSIAMGGNAVANSDDEFASMAVNPALLGYVVDTEFSASVVAGVADGEYYNRDTGRGFLDKNSGLIPEIVIQSQIRDRVGLGISIIPEQARLGDWIYNDARGGIDGSTSYGRRHHRSKISGIRTAVGAGVQITDTLSLGASVGVLYNENELVSPYTFQSHPVLAGFKTLLELETEGTGINGDFGLTWRPSDELTLGLAYRTPTRVETSGSARGDIDAQFRSLGLGSAASTFAYDAEVVNHFPDQVSFGGKLRISDKTSISAEIDWVRWSNAFQKLTVDLDSGNNSTINSVLGNDGFSDTIPLNWRDVVVYKIGFEHRLSETWSIRGGYKYGESPIPADTLLPMIAAISEHTLTAGVSYERGPYEISLAYQRDLPAFETISNTRILSGEYEGSTVGISANWIALSVTYEF